MTDEKKPFDVEQSRIRFSGRIRGDLSNLYRVYCRVRELAEISNDDDLKKAANDLLQVWDDIATTSTVKVLANGYVEWIKEVCPVTLEDGLASVARLASDGALHSNLSEDEFLILMNAVQRHSDKGGLYADIHKAMWAVNDLMEFDQLERGVLWKMLLAVLKEAWHDDAA